MIPICKPLFGVEELRAIEQPLSTGWVVQGPWVERFEHGFAEFIAAPHCAATSSCTTALHLAVHALGLRPGDEVIVPAFTWVSTPNAVEYQGAKPVFCDIELDTFNVAPEHLASQIGPRTVGILPVHLFGLCADMDALLAIAARHGVWVVEDAACAFGSRYRGRHAGTFGVFGAFSFHPRKSITTGEGGMLCCADDGLDRLVRSLRDHGSGRHEIGAEAGFGSLLGDYPRLGFNYRMTDIQGALGCAQLARAAEILAARARLARRYDELLASVPWLRRPRAAAEAESVHGYQAYVCLFAPEVPSLRNVARLHDARNRLMQRLEQRGIATRQGTHAPIALRYYAQRYGLRVEDFPNAWLADRLSIALPLFPQMTDIEQEFIVNQLCEAIDE